MNMSLGIHPVFDPKLHGIRFESLGEVLANNFEVLDDIAAANKLTPLTAFADTREVPDGFDGTPDDLEDTLGPWTEWFDPAEGRSAIQALLDYINANPEEVSNASIRRDQLIEELEELARVSAVAASRNVRFRLEMS
jgi:hypothetical protein